MASARSRPPRGHRFGVQQIQAPHVVVRCKPTRSQTLAARAGETRVVAITRCRPAPASRQHVRNGTLDHLDPNSGLVLNVTSSGMWASARRDGSSVQLSGRYRRSPPARAPCVWQWSSWHLAIGDLADCARILSLHATECVPASGSPYRSMIQSVTGSRAVIAAARSARPRGARHGRTIPRPSEVRQPLVGGIDTLRVGTCARRHRLHAFPLSVAITPGVSGKRRSLRRRSQDFPIRWSTRPTVFSLTIQQVFHPTMSRFPPD